MTVFRFDQSASINSKVHLNDNILFVFAAEFELLDLLSHGYTCVDFLHYEHLYQLQNRYGSSEYGLT